MKVTDIVVDVIERQARLDEARARRVFDFFEFADAPVARTKAAVAIAAVPVSARSKSSQIVETVPE